MLSCSLSRQSVDRLDQICLQYGAPGTLYLLLANIEATVAVADIGTVEPWIEIICWALDWKFSCEWFTFQEESKFMIRFHASCTKRSNGSGSVKWMRIICSHHAKHIHCTFQLWKSCSFLEVIISFICTFFISERDNVRRNLRERLMHHTLSFSALSPSIL